MRPQVALTTLTSLFFLLACERASESVTTEHADVVAVATNADGSLNVTCADGTVEDHVSRKDFDRNLVCVAPFVCTQDFVYTSAAIGDEDLTPPQIDGQICTEIVGRLWLSATSLTDISAFQKITSADWIQFVSNHSLNSLEGLKNLTKAKSLTILQNGPAMVVEHFNSLTTVDSLSINVAVEVKNFPKLTSVKYLSFADISLIEGFSALETVGSLSIARVPSSEFPELKTVGAVDASNRGLTSTFDLPRLPKVEAVNSLTISGSLSLAGMESLGSVDSLFVSNLSIESFEGLRSLRRVKSLRMHDMEMQSIAGLTLEAPIEDLFLANNQKLISLEGLNLSSSMGIVDLYRNNSLRSLEGFRGVQEFRALLVNENKGLTSLTGLESLTSLGQLRMNNNAHLPANAPFTFATSAGSTLVGITTGIVDVSGNGADL